MPAVGKASGCDMDWPNQPFGTCCLKQNEFGAGVCKGGAPPACLANCAVTCDAPTPAPTPSTCTEGASSALPGAECQVCTVRFMLWYFGLCPSA